MPMPLAALGRAGQWLGHELLELLCPAGCAVCGVGITDSSDVLCDKCWRKLHESLQGDYCCVCGRTTGPYVLVDGRCHRCRRRRGAISQLVRVGRHTGPLRDLILAFKFAKQSQLDRFLGSLLASAIVGKADFGAVDALAPVPLHWRRRLGRGYDQAELLARGAAAALARNNLRVGINRDLVRVRWTIPQTHLPTSKRLRNLRRAFAVRPGAKLAGKHLCLIDDVSTTGTTLRLAGRALKKAGAARVSAAVLAVAGHD